MEVIEQVPKTALDVFKLLPEGTLCEVIDNVLYMSPAPKYTHQNLVALLVRRIGNFLEITNIGEIIVSPFDVYLEQFLSAVQPDLLVMLNDNRHILKDDGCIHGAPDLIIEVLSADKKRDTVMKKSLYERAGVKEYIIINPLDRKTQCFQLTNNKYELAHEAEGIFKSTLLDFTFPF